MISVSSDYKNYISNNLSVSAKNKIIVDGVEYLGNVLKTYPKISHSSSKICGSFPSKTVSFEIYDLNNNLDFEGKEIEVYKGLMLNGTPYYLKQGVFIPQKNNITTNISDRSIKFDNVQDKTQFLDDKYESDLDWSNGQKHTGLEIVQEICTKKNLTLKSNSFSWANYSFKQPNFPSNITYRQVLARLAEIGGEIVIFDYNGYLEFKSQYTTGDTIARTRYEKISKEKSITFNSVVLGKEGINDDIKYPDNMLDSNRVSLRIEDNPFVDLYREEMIETVAQYIIGISYVPFEISNVMDGFIYELNDVISIIDRNNETLRAVILSIDNNSRIKSNLKLNTSNKDSTNYNLAGSVKDDMNNLKFDVDYINNQIKTVVSKTNEVDITVNGKYDYVLTEDLEFEEDKNYYKYLVTEDINYLSNKNYYRLSDGAYILLIVGEDYEVGETIESTIYENTQLEEGTDYEIGESISSKSYQVFEYILTGGYSNQLEELSGDYNDLIDEVAKKANSSDVSSQIQSVESRVETVETNTYTKTQIQQIANGTGVNGVKVTAVVTTEGTFDKDGMHYEKTGAPSKSTINEKGVEVDITSDDSVSLYAGYVAGSDTRFNTSTRQFQNKSIVFTQNLVNKGDAILGNHTLIMDYEDEDGNEGTGWFVI